MKILNRVHLHPYLLGIFPLLSLYAHNQSQLEPNAPWRALAVIIMGTTLVLIILRLCFKDWRKAGLITSYASLAFFLYNPLREILHNVHTSTFNLGWNRYFFPLWLLILILGTWVIVKKLSASGSTIPTFNLVALAALLLPLVSVVSYSISHSSGPAAQPSGSLNRRIIAAVEAHPDIYHIILDMYGRSDTIEEEFRYDNSQFLNQLRSQGFYVAACSTANYPRTVLSMASSLNMNFLPALGDDFVAGNTDYSNAAALIENNAVRQYLQSYGYAFVSFATNFPYLNISEADIYIEIPEAQRKDNIPPFELLPIEQTPVRIFMDEIISYNSKIEAAKPIRYYGSNYDQTLFVLQQLTQLPTAVPGPKFVYAHLIIPHPPYVFGPQGEYVGNDPRLNGKKVGNNVVPVDEAAYHEGYTNHLRYLDSVMPNIIEQIVSQSNIPPIIIVQGDHGFWGDAYKRLPILNAYYLPGKDASRLLYPDITPVNSFRVVLNAYFDARFTLLPDENYLSPNDEDFLRL